MGTAQPPTFGELLKRHRLAAALSQEALAERAGLSVEAISTLERGLKQTPYRDTVRLLVSALELAPEEAASLEAAVPRRRGPPGAPTMTAAQAAPPVGRSATEPPPPAAHPATSSPLPTGTLTFLLTDIEGSTSFWDQHPAAMQAAIIRHDALIDAVLAQHGGRQIKERGEGDSIFAVFTSASHALAAVCALQQALQGEPWPHEAPLRVRMGLHTGEADQRGIGYYGGTVNRTARLRSLAHGGQILLSRSTYDLVRDDLPAGVGLRPLGVHALTGLQRAEEVFQVLPAGLPVEFPPLRSPQAPRTNLPVQATSFIGRQREQEEVVALLGRAPLVTLTGSAGAGKTRLALQVAAQLSTEYPDGVWLVELATLAAPALVPQAVAAVLGVQEQPGRPLLATLCAVLQPKRLLLVLDNCEHLISSTATLVTALLRSCAALHLLATSRAGLEVAGETTYRVPSLPVPDLAHLPPTAQLAQCSAVDLFVQRAQARRPEFTLTAQNIAPVSQICVRLDGIPLAIELAAARVVSLPVEGIAARLDERFQLLTGGPRDAPARQKTLRATMDWSWELLGTEEQALLRRLSVFAGGWTLPAAEAICGGDGGRERSTLDLLDGLANKSLIQMVGDEGGARYRLLETVRQFALEHLEASGESATLREAHLAWCVRVAEDAATHLWGAEQTWWLAQLEAEFDNLRAALAWSDQRGDAEALARMTTALRLFWEAHGRLEEGAGWMQAALGHRSEAPTAVRAQLLIGAAQMASYRNDLAQAAAFLDEAEVLWHASADPTIQAEVLTHRGYVAGQAREWQVSLRLHREAAERWHALEAHGREADSLTGAGHMALLLGDVASAAADFQRALSVQRHLGSVRGIADNLLSLGFLAFLQGDRSVALPLLDEALDLLASQTYQPLLARAFEAIGFTAAMRGLVGEAATLMGAAEAYRERIGVPMTPAYEHLYQQALAASRAGLDATSFGAAWAEGRSISGEQATGRARSLWTLAF